MILTDREIQTAISRRTIIIDPAPAEKAYSSTSVDLTLDPNLRIFKPKTDGIDTIIDPSVDNFNAEKILKELTYLENIPLDGYILKQNTLVLAYSKEYIDLRPCPKFAARVEGKSSLSRIGLSVHITAPTIHSGFDGRIRLEIVNHGHLPIKLKSGMRICQLIFEQTLGTPDRGYGGQFSGQRPA
ncbi:MAG: dCTP deaminase [Methylocella sp.]